MFLWNLDGRAERNPRAPTFQAGRFNHNSPPPPPPCWVNPQSAECLTHLKLCLNTATHNFKWRVKWHTYNLNQNICHSVIFTTPSDWTIWRTNGGIKTPILPVLSQKAVSVHGSIDATSTSRVLSQVEAANEDQMTIILCKVKRQYLIDSKVSRYCLLPLHGSTFPSRLSDMRMKKGAIEAHWNCIAEICQTNMDKSF